VTENPYTDPGLRQAWDEGRAAGRADTSRNMIRMLSVLEKSGDQDLAIVAQELREGFELGLEDFLAKQAAS
jgi:hypothetical protein